MADEKDPILGISVTIKGDEIKKGADMFVQQIDRMEKASDKASVTMSKSFQLLNIQLIKVNEQLQLAETRLRNMAGLLQKTGGTADSSQITALQNQVQQLTKEREMLQQQLASINSKSGASASGSVAGSVASVTKEQVKEAQQEVKFLEQELKRLNREYEAYDNKIAKLKSQAASAPDMSKRHDYERQIADAQKKQSAVGQQIKDTLPEYNEAKKKLEAMGTGMEKTGKKTDSLRAQLRKLKEEMALLKKTDPEYQKKAEEARNLQGQIAKINDETSRQSTILTRLLGGTKNYQQMLSMLPAPIKSAVTQFQQFIKVGLKFIATPIGAVVTALALAFKALSSWLTNTYNGQLVYTKYAGYLDGVLKKITKDAYALLETLIGVNKEIDKAGSKKISGDSGDSENKEGNIVSRTINKTVNKVKSSWDLLEQGANFINAYFKERNAYATLDKTKEQKQEEARKLQEDALKKIKEDFITVSGRAGILAGAMYTYSKALNGAGNSASELALAQKELAIRMSVYKARYSVLDAQISALQAALNDLNVSNPNASYQQRAGNNKQKKEIIQSIGDLREDKAQEQRKEAQEQYNLIRKKYKVDSVDVNTLLFGIDSQRNELMRQKNLSEDAIKEISEAYTRLNQAENNIVSNRQQTENEIKQINQQINQEHIAYVNQQQEFALNQIKIEKDLLRKEEDLANTRTEIIIKSFKDGVQKRMRLRKLEHEKELQQIERQRQDEIAQAKSTARQEYSSVDSLKGRSVNPLVFADNITEEQYNSLRPEEKVIRDRYDKRVSQANQTSENSTKSANMQYNDISDLLSQYQDYTAKKLQLDIQYGEDKARIEEAIHAQEKIAQDSSLQEHQRKRAEYIISQYKGVLNERTNQYNRDTKSLNEENASKVLQEKTVELKKNPAYMMAMQDVRKVSTEALGNLLKQLKEVESEVAKLDPDQAQAIANLMNSINRELIERNPFENLKTQLNKVNELKNEKNALKAIKDNGGGTYDGKTYTREEAEKRLVQIEGELYIAHQNYQTALDKSTNTLQTIFGQLNDIGSKIGGKWGNAISGVASLGSSMLSFRQNYSESALKANNMMSEDGKLNAAGRVSTVLAAAQAAYQAGETIASIIPRKSSHEEYEKYAQAQAEINNLTQSVMAYEIAALKAAQADENWFGNDSLGKLRDSWEVASKAKDQYFTKLKEQQETYQNKDKDDNWSGIVASAFVGAVTGGIIGAVKGTAAGPGWGTIIGAAVGSAVGTAAGIATNNLVTSYDPRKSSAYNNLRIETRAKKNSFLGFGGHDQETEDLRTWARKKYGDDLFDAEGWVNVELAQQLIEEYGEKLQGQTQETLEKLIELKEQYDEYKEALQEYVSSLYEPLVDNMVDALWEWFDTGKDALASFKESASQTFRSIVTDMMRTIVLSKVFDSYQDNIEALYEKYSQNLITEQDLMVEVAKETNDLMNRYEANIPVLETTLDTISSTLEQYGIDLSSSSSSSSSSGGAFSGMTQDVGNEMNGRLTTIQLQGESIIGQLTIQTVTMASLSENIGITMGYVSEIRDIQLTSQEHLRKIQQNTNELYEINQRLENIDNNTKKL